MDRRHFITYILASMGALGTIPSAAHSKEKVLILGIFPRRNIKVTYKLFAPMARYLSQQLGQEVVLETTKSFQEFWINVQKGRYDIVHFNQYHYILSHQSHGYDVVAANKELNSSTIAGSLIVRKDSGINHISELKFLAKTEQMVHLPWAVRNDLSMKIKSKIKNVLVNLNTNPDGLEILSSANLNALLPVVDSDFNKHRKIITDVYGDDYGLSKLK